MHEHSIAISVIDICIEQLQKSRGTKIQKIVLEIGELAGVEISSFGFILKEVVKNTELEKAELIIESKQGRARCIVCESVFTLINFYDPCPDCKNFTSEIIQGKELKIKSIEII